MKGLIPGFQDRQAIYIVQLYNMYLVYVEGSQSATSYTLHSKRSRCDTAWPYGQIFVESAVHRFGTFLHPPLHVGISLWAHWWLAPSLNIRAILERAPPFLSLDHTAK